MGDLETSLDLDIEEITPEKRAITPRLLVEVSAEASRHTVEPEQISTETIFRFQENNKHVDGPIPTVPIGQIGRIKSQDTTFKIRIDFSRRELDLIEQHREGGDISIDIILWIIGTSNDRRQEGRFELSETLIDGEWTRILDAFDYHDKRDVQLDLSAKNPRIRDRLQTAHGKIEGAQRKHDTGDYPSAVTECRRAIETLQEIEETSEVLHERKYEELDDIMGKFESGFAGGLSHAEEKTNIDAALRRDSEFALNLTKACARYISVALEEENG